MKGFPQAKKWPGKKILQGQGKVRKLNPTHIITLKAGRIIWDHCDLNYAFFMCSKIC